MFDPSLINREYWSATVLMEAGAILRFIESVGGEPPSVDASTPLEAPAALVLSLVPFEALGTLLGTEARQIHASEFQLEQLHPVRAGDRLEVRSTIVDSVRHEGALSTTDVVTVDDEGRDGTSGQIVYRARRIYAVLGPKGRA